MFSFIFLCHFKAKDIQDMTPLHTAVAQSHVDIVKMLIKAGADLRCVDDELSTPLHEAAAVDCDKTVKLILNACKKEISGYTEVRSNVKGEELNKQTYIRPDINQFRKRNIHLRLLILLCYGSSCILLMVRTVIPVTPLSRPYVS